MATIFTLGPSGDTVDLADNTKHHIAMNGIEIRPTRQRTVVAVSGRDAVRLAYSQATELEIVATISVTGADHNTFITNWRNILDKLRKARAFSLDGERSQVEFTYQWANATASVVFDVMDGDFPPVPELANPFMPQWIDAKLVLVCLPYGRASTASTPSSGTLTNDTTGWTPAAIGGDVPAPARLRIQNKQAAVNMNFIRAATRSRGTPANFISQFLPGNPSPTGYSVTMGTNGSRIASVKVTARARVVAGTTGSFWLIWRSGAGTNFRFASMIQTTSASYVNFTRAQMFNPATGNTFTIAELNAGQWGVQQVGTTAIRVTQLYVTVTYLDRDLAQQTINLVPNADGATSAWTRTGAATNFGCIGDPVGTPDDDTTYLSSVTDAQVSLVTVPAFTTIDALTSGIRAAFRNLAVNGRMEGSFEDNAPPGWITVSGTPTSVAGFEGLQAVRLTSAVVSQRIAVSASTVYRVRGYLRRVSGTGLAEIVATPEIGTATNGQQTSTTFLPVNFTVTTGVGCTFLDLQLDSTVSTDTVEFDAVSVVPDSTVLTNGAEAVRITINANIADHYGAFRCQIRGKPPNGAMQGQLRWGGTTGGLITNEAVSQATIAGAAVGIVDLGRINIPEQVVPSDIALASSTFSVWVVRDSTTQNYADDTVSLDIDTIELWPAENYVEFEPTTGPSQDQFAVIDSLARIPTAFLADSLGNRIQTLSHVGTPPVLDVGTTRVLFRASRSRTDDRRADSIAADLRFFQRYEMQRGAG